MSKKVDKEMSTSDVMDFKNYSLGNGEDTGDFVVVEDEIMEIDEMLNPIDPGWHDYVMGKFIEEELKSGKPTVDGLRRVTELLLGPILECKSEVLQLPHNDHDRRATVKVTLHIEYEPQDIRGVDGVASVYWGNTDSPYRNYPVATAETRAEGRALRKALRLRVLAEEETGVVVDHDYSETEARNEGLITPTQVKFLGVMGERLRLNIQKMVNKSYPEVKNIKDMQHADSLALQKKLSEYQQDAESIPDDIKGFEADWQTKF